MERRRKEMEMRGKGIEGKNGKQERQRGSNQQRGVKRKR